MNLSVLGWTPGRLARNTLWAISGQTARLLIQATYFILIARSLGASNYGAFVSVAALIAVFSAFAGMGTGPLLIKHVSRNAELLSAYWGRALGIAGISGIFLTLICLGIASWVIPSNVPRSLVLMLAVSDLVLMPMYITCAQVFQARERLGTTAVLQIVLSISRLCAVLIMITDSPSPTAQDLAQYYLMATLISSIIGVSYVAYKFGPPRWMRRGFVSDLRQGLGFASSSTAQYITANIDKTLLAQMSSTSATGVYTAAQRVIEVALIPVFALLAAAIPRFFQEGKKGVLASLTVAYGLLPILFLYAGFAALALYLTAPMLPLLFGPQFQESESVARWLAILPFLHMLHAVAADALSGAGYQKLRSLIEISAAVLNVFLNWMWIGKYSYLGAVWALLTTFMFSASALWFASTRIRHQ